MTVVTEDRKGEAQSSRTAKVREVASALLRTSQRLQRRTSQAIEPFDLTTQQYNVLRILRGAKGEPVTPTEIVERMVEDTPGATRLLDRLEAKGLVTRDRCREDRRLVYCYPTEAALELLARLDTPVEAADEEVLAPLSSKEVERLEQLLSKLWDTK